MGVGAADPEGGHGGAAELTGGGPLAWFGEEFDGAGLPVDLAGGLSGVQGPGQPAVAHGHDHLDDSGDSGRGLGVSDVGLHRPQPQRLRTVLTVGGQEGLGLDRVAERGAGAVCLHGVHLAGFEPGVGEGGADDALLGRAVGGGQAVGRAVLVDGGPPHDGEHLVPVATGVAQPLQEQHPHALAPAGAVRALRERLAAAVQGEAALAGEVDEGVGGRHDGHPTGQGEPALTGAQRLHGQVEGDEGGGAGGVDRDGRALEAEGVGHTAGGDAAEVAVAEVSLDAFGDFREPAAVVVVHHTRVDAGAAAAQGVRVDAGAFERLPGGLQQQALLRVHRDGLARADAEEPRVETRCVVEESALAHMGAARRVGVGVVDGVDVPVPVRGEVAHGVHSGVDQLPQLLGRADAAGVAAAHGDDGDGLVRGFGDPVVGPAQPLVLEHGLTQRLDDLLDRCVHGRCRSLLTRRR